MVLFIQFATITLSRHQENIQQLFHFSTFENEQKQKKDGFFVLLLKKQVFEL